MSTTNNCEKNSNERTGEHNFRGRNIKVLAGVVATLTIAVGWGKVEGKQVEDIATNAGWPESSLHRSGLPVFPFSRERVSAITGVPSEEGIDPKKAKLGCEFYFGKGPVNKDISGIHPDTPVVRVVNYQTGQNTWHDDGISPSRIVGKYPECFGDGLTTSSDGMLKLAGLAVANGFTHLTVVNEDDGRERLEIGKQGSCTVYFGNQPHPVTQADQTFALIQRNNSGDKVAVVDATPKTVAGTLDKKC